MFICTYCTVLSSDIWVCFSIVQLKKTNFFLLTSVTIIIQSSSYKCSKWPFGQDLPDSFEMNIVGWILLLQFTQNTEFLRILLNFYEEKNSYFRTTSNVTKTEPYIKLNLVWFALSSTCDWSIRGRE